MGRGAYDTTGTPKPRNLDRGSNASEHVAQITRNDGPSSPTIQNHSDLGHDRMDIDPKEDASSDQAAAEVTELSSLADALHVDRDQAVLIADQQHSANHRSTRLTIAQRRPLEDWLDENSLHPYPSHAEKEQLASASGLSAIQVMNYLNNYRRRRLVKAHAGSEAGAEPFASSSDQASFEQMDGQQQAQGFQDIPLDKAYPSPDPDIAIASIECAPASTRYQRSSNSPSVEPANSPANTLDYTEEKIPPLPSGVSILDWWLDMLYANFSTPEISVLFFIPSPLPERESDLEPMVLAPTPSFGGVDETCGDDTRSISPSMRSAANSLPYNACRSMKSVATNTSRGSRQGIRAFVHESKQPCPTIEGQHQCSICGKGFSRSYTLERHVETVHKGREHWLCGPLITETRSFLCPVCLEDPSDCTHGMLECWDKQHEKRTFYRKDGLTQHLRSHGLIATNGGIKSFFAQQPENRRTAIDINPLIKPEQHPDLRSDLRPDLSPQKSIAIDIIRRIGGSFVTTRRDCLEWATQQQALSIESFESCWLEAVNVFLYLGFTELSLSGSIDNIDYFVRQLRAKVPEDVYQI